MSYTDRPGYTPVDPVVTNQVVEYHDRVRWGPIISGLVIAISLQLVLSALGAAVGASTIAGSGAPRTNAGGAATGVGIWAVISLLISLFLGGYTTARACGPMTRSSAILNGGILWATTLAFGSWLLASGVSGTFGVLASNAGAVANQVLQSGQANVPNSVPSPNVTAQQTRDIAGNIANTNWWFALGSLLSLIAALVGATVGTRNHRTRA
jgi:hypothetical protein